jgi:hypothetical protein
MKKLAILFLLTTVLISFSFAQVTVQGGLEFKHLNEGNDEKLTPILYTEFVGTAATPLGPGSIGAELALGTGLAFQEDADAYDTHGDTYLKGFYELPAGPGTLSFALRTFFGDRGDGEAQGFGDLRFNADYAGLAAGPATLGFGLEYDFTTSGEDDAGDGQIFGDDKDNKKYADAVDLKFTAAFAFGLGIEYHFKYALAKDNTTGDPDENYIAEIVKLNVSYALPSIPLKIGGELTDTGGWNTADDKQAFFGGDGTKGFAFKPYATYGISEKLTAGLEIPISGINADDNEQEDIDVGVNVYIKYAF